MNNIKLLEHPLIQHKLANLRNRKTSSKDFRESLKEITILMAYEVLKDIKVSEVSIITPIAKTKGKKIDQEINIFPILRAGQGLVDGFLSVVPNARIGHIGLYRDKKTLKPVKYLFKYPENKTNNTFNILLDPIIATGGSIIEALETLKEKNFENIKVIAIVSVQSTLEKVIKQFPDVEIYVAAIDKKLNENGYIVPGLGDAGDRIYGTK